MTILSERLYNLFPKEKRPKLQKAKRGLIVAEAGKEMNTCGTFDANFKLGEFEFNWPVYVAPIGDDILLGCDIIDEMDITVNTKRGIQVKDQWVECEITRSHDAVGPVKIARAVTVPALSEFIMTANCRVKPNDDRQTFLFEASKMAKENLLIARSLVSPRTGIVPVKVINQSASPVKLKKGVVLGTLQPVRSIMSTQDYYDISQHREGISVCQLKSHEDQQHRQQPTDTEIKRNSKNNTFIDDTDFSCVTDIEECLELPEHVQDLFNQSSKSLETEQKIKLANLLNKYQDSFAKSRTEYGKCSVLKHKIDTAEAAPVRQPLRRTPQAFEGEEEKYILEQVAAGVIQPSS